MNPSSNEAGGLNLPPPINEQQPDRAQAGEQLPVAPELAAAGPEVAPAPSHTAPVAAPSLPLPAPQAVTQQVSPQSDVMTATDITITSVNDDSDLIEKEWVNKAKQIVEKTREDPHKQSEELTIFKADYLQKRYNKTIKVNK